MGPSLLYFRSVSRALIMDYNRGIKILIYCCYFVELIHYECSWIFSIQCDRTTFNESCIHKTGPDQNTMLMFIYNNTTQVVKYKMMKMKNEKFIIQ